MSDRIDFLVLKDTVVVNKFECREGRDIPISHSVKPDFDLGAALAWCEGNGYTVRQWDTGARAWKGTPRVIRSRAQIIKARARFSGEGKVHMDFAYDG